ncbi:MAG: hypothetical protein ACK55Z_35945 [bacterium]
MQRALRHGVFFLVLLLFLWVNLALVLLRHCCGLHFNPEIEEPKI